MTSALGLQTSSLGSSTISDDPVSPSFITDQWDDFEFYDPRGLSRFRRSESSSTGTAAGDVVGDGVMLGGEDGGPGRRDDCDQDVGDGGSVSKASSASSATIRFSDDEDEVSRHSSVPTAPPPIMPMLDHSTTTTTTPAPPVISKGFVSATTNTDTPPNDTEGDRFPFPSSTSDQNRNSGPPNLSARVSTGSLNDAWENLGGVGHQDRNQKEVRFFSLARTLLSSRAGVAFCERRV